MKIQELRERLRGHQPQAGSEIKYAISQIWPATDDGKLREDGSSEMRAQELNARVSPAVEPETDTVRAAQPPAGPEAFAAVAAMFRFTNGFEEHTLELIRALEPLEALSQSAAKELGPLEDFRGQIAQLATTLEPMRAFYQQLRRLARDFAPMKTLHEQVIRVPEEFCIQLTRLAESLAPAKSFRHRIEELAKAFEPVDRLEAQFLELAEAFAQVVDGESLSSQNGRAGEAVLNGETGSQSEAGQMEISPARAGSAKPAWVLG